MLSDLAEIAKDTVLVPSNFANQQVLVGLDGSYQLKISYLYAREDTLHSLEFVAQTAHPTMGNLQ